MQIPEDMRRCVCFIGYQIAEREVFGGSGFFFELELGKRELFPTIVTARHVIEKIRKLGAKTVLVRFTNSDDKTELVKIGIDDWKFHPKDPFVDVAVCKIPSDTTFGFTGFGDDMALTDELIEREPIGPGDEVFFPGLFRPHYGAEKHIPIIRSGNIAAMPEEPVKINLFGNKVGIDAFLIEARSIGGLSGSPAFVHVGMHRHRQKVDEEGREKHVIVTKPNRFYFMGLVHGHYNLPEEDETERINSGIAIVVPVWKVLEVVRHLATTEPYTNTGVTGPTHG
jgi:hypothetical protein